MRGASLSCASACSSTEWTSVRYLTSCSFIVRTAMAIFFPPSTRLSRRPWAGSALTADRDVAGLGDGADAAKRAVVAQDALHVDVARLGGRVDAVLAGGNVDVDVAGVALGVHGHRLGAEAQAHVPGVGAGVDRDRMQVAPRDVARAGPQVDVPGEVVDVDVARVAVDRGVDVERPGEREVHAAAVRQARGRA